MPREEEEEEEGGDRKGGRGDEPLCWKNGLIAKKRAGREEKGKVRAEIETHCHTKEQSMHNEREAEGKKARERGSRRKCKKREKGRELRKRELFV